jgi:hypothetical protein
MPIKIRETPKKGNLLAKNELFRAFFGPVQSQKLFFKRLMSPAILMNENSYWMTLWPLRVFWGLLSKVLSAWSLCNK